MTILETILLCQEDGGGGEGNEGGKMFCASNLAGRIISKRRSWVMCFRNVAFRKTGNRRVVYEVCAIAIKVGPRFY